MAMLNQDNLFETLCTAELLDTLACEYLPAKNVDFNNIYFISNYRLNGMT